MAHIGFGFIGIWSLDVKILHDFDILHYQYSHGIKYLGSCRSFFAKTGFLQQL